MPARTSSILSLAAICGLAPVLAFAAEPIQMAPTPAKQPKALPPSTHVIDRVIPAYGVQPATSRGYNRAVALYHEIRAFTADVEGRVMAGELRRASVQAVDKKGRPIAGGKSQAQPVAEEAQLLALLERLTTLDRHMHVPGAEFPIAEQWLLDESFSGLHRANDLLRMGLSDDSFKAIDAAPRAAAPAPVTAGKPPAAAKPAAPTPEPAAPAEPAAEPAAPAEPAAEPTAPAEPAAEAPAEAPAEPAAEAPAEPAAEAPAEPAAEAPAEPAAEAPAAPAEEAAAPAEAPADQ